MLFFGPLSRPSRLLAIVALALPFGVSGACGGGTACFQYTQPEYALHGNSCPAQDDALANFSNPECPGSVAAVDSAGSFDGQLCCYAVTYSSLVPDCGVADPSGSGDGTFISPPGTGHGGAGFGVTEATFESVGPGGGSSTNGDCQPTCADALAKGKVPCNGNGMVIFEQLENCACGSGNPCNGACEPLCQSLGIDADCSTCLQSGCSTQLLSCQSN
jgi:hypothetical protein